MTKRPSTLRMLRHLFLSLLVVGILSPLAQTTCGAARPQSPNIVLIHIDDMDFDEIGAYAGAGKVWTPNLDGLVNGGMKFTRGYVTTPVCVPSRFATVTGRYASRCKYFADNIPANHTLNLENTRSARNSHKTPPVVEEDEYTFAKLMKGAGYVTGMVGKWHNDHDHLRRPVPDLIKGDARDPEIAAAIRDQYEEILARVKKHSGFDFLERLYYDNKEQFSCPEELHTLNSPWITEGALKFLEQHKNRPFVLYYSNPIPHGQLVKPLVRKKPFPAGTMGKKIEENALGDRLLATPAGYLAKTSQVQPSTEDMLERFRAHAPEAHPDAALLTWLDDSVGAILGKLRELDVEDNTLIFLISDHQSVDKFTPFEQGARVPFAVNWPGHIKPGTISDSLVTSLDITATMCDVVGAPIPADCVLDGVSMLPLFRDPQATIRNDFLIEFGYGRSVVTKDWQYIALRFPAGFDLPTPENPQLHTGGNRKDRSSVMVRRHPSAFDADQLYNLTRDPAQTKNAWSNPENQAVRMEMQARLQEYLQQFPHTFGEFTEKDR